MKKNLKSLIKENNETKYKLENINYKDEKSIKSLNNLNYNFALYDTGLQIAKPSSSVPLNYLTPIIGELMPTYLYLNFEHELTLDDINTSFIKSEFLVKPNPTTKIVSGQVYQTADWTVDYIELRGNSTVLYKGIPSRLSWDYVFSFPNGIFTEDELDTYSIPTAHTKTVHRGTFEYTDDYGDKYRIVDSLIMAVSVLNLADDQPTGFCSGEVNYDSMVYTPFTSISRLLPHEMGVITTQSFSKILNITTSNIYGIGTYCTERWVEDIEEETCNLEKDATDDVTDTVSLDTSERVVYYTWGRKYKWVLGAWKYQSNSLNYIDTENVTITLKEFTYDDEYYVYWSSNTENYMVVDYPGGKDGYLSNIALENLPTMTPYTTINLKRNPEPFPQISDLTFEDEELHFVSNPQLQIIGRSNENNILKNYLIRTNQYVIISAPALNSITREIPEYNDDYTHTGTTYELTNENHILKNRYLYYGSSDDVIYRGRILSTNYKYRSQIENINET